jgi:hypothetical protein
MNEIFKRPLPAVGYQFVKEEYLKEGDNEYYLRNLQNRSGIEYRNLSAYEIEVLVRNNNTSDNWNNIQVSDAFNPELVKTCKFYGLVRIGKLEPFSLQYHSVSLPVGLYNSTIISCDLGDNVVVNNVNYLSHYIIGNEVMIANVHEFHVTDHAKFGNGIIKEGEDESIRVWIEICNENAGRKILPFNGMLTGDAWLWSKYRGDQELMQKFKEFTEKKFDRQRGYYGKVGDRCVIKNTSIIKDVWIGSNAYIKGANKLKNLTINSSEEAPSQIGEGCEIVNGIIGFGCRLFYGVKAVRFVMGAHSQLKYGARLINSYLGENSTISCCEVLNSLIFPAHEQHHNNSFLCASVVMGQSNIAAGATIGSNHNSRAADGEMVAARGFWPGLCVSLKHNSKFSSFTLLAKGDYPFELNIPIPFSLVSNDEGSNRLVIMPGYWFLYNLYALARNSGKYVERDRRKDRTQHIEYDFLAPDSVNELFQGLDHIRRFVALNLDKSLNRDTDNAVLLATGERMLQDKTIDWSRMEIKAAGLENSKRDVVLLKVKEATEVFRKLIHYYGVTQLLRYCQAHKIQTFAALMSALPDQPERLSWTNIGGQLVPLNSLQTLMKEVKDGTIDGWEGLHDFYRQNGALYPEQKMQHAWASLLGITGLKKDDITLDTFREWLQQTIDCKEWMVKNIYEARAKDYQSEFRKMIYDSEEEMEAVIGRLEDNVFIKQQQEELAELKKQTSSLLELFASGVIVMAR